VSSAKRWIRPCQPIIDHTRLSWVSWWTVLQWIHHLIRSPQVDAFLRRAPRASSVYIDWWREWLVHYCSSSQPIVDLTACHEVYWWSPPARNDCVVVYKCVFSWASPPGEAAFIFNFGEFAAAVINCNGVNNGQYNRLTSFIIRNPPFLCQFGLQNWQSNPLFNRNDWQKIDNTPSNHYQTIELLMGFPKHCSSSSYVHFWRRKVWLGENWWYYPLSSIWSQLMPQLPWLCPPNRVLSIEEIEGFPMVPNSLPFDLY